MRNITISGARIHNLKNVNVSIPKDQLIAVTGISGSGKSSLAFDIVFEEGRTQYLQSIGMLADIAEENKFEQIAGIGPTVAVQQAIIRQSNPRSVVGTRTRILAYLGALYAHEGYVTCSSCGTLLGGSWICSRCGNSEEKLSSNAFSFNSPNGMCLACSGRGTRFELVMERLVPDASFTLRQVLANVGMLSSFQYLLKGRLKQYADTPFCQMPADAQEQILHGVTVGRDAGRRSHAIFGLLQHRLSHGEDVGGMMEVMPCPECQGYRVGEEARGVTLCQKHIGQLGHMTIADLRDFLDELAAREHFSTYGQNLAREVLQKTSCLIEVGLGHLTLYREMPSLSGGEIQRLFLASHLDSKMDSLIYVLDEPTVGLHEVEKGSLLDQIMALRDLGNTVIVVEHDRNTIERAEHIIDFGPLAGSRGGEIVYQGDFAGLLASERSITGQYFSGYHAVPHKTSGDIVPVTDTTPRLTLYHAETNNLKNVTVSFPLGMLVGVAGVSGSGKSSLVSNTLVPLLERHFADAREREQGSFGEEDEEDEFVVPSPVAERLDGLEHIDGYAQVLQSPIGRHHNSNPVSYINIWGKIRKLFAGQPLAKERGYTPGHFSFNAGGACPECAGQGRHRIWLGGSFFVYNTCPACHGHRYQREVLDVIYQSKSILDVLDMDVEEAARFFEAVPSIYAMLGVLERTGMGYIRLGQPASTLSGGEAQRIKLAREIGRRRRGNILYILDEPTTGLSLYDTTRLIALLDELVRQGSSVIVIEHDPAVLSYCDWLIELGPGGGSAGGQVIAEGTPLALARDPKSKTGPFLKPDDWCKQ
ncbi:MAG: excinuclease ABC subunit UvrA [Anaerolineae bacterium]|nr:excinuclease ABC subunit UvrA [Anaerolineae bacterium]